jgi:tol-pal system protein YbgF
VAPPAVLAVDPAARQADYQKAFDTLKAGKYMEAIAGFQTFVARYPAGELSDNAQYWLGEAYYVNRDFAAAQQAFRKMVANFPQSAKVADASLKLAFIEYENGQYGQAKTLLNDIVKRYPESSAAKMAEKRLERMKQENH